MWHCLADGGLLERTGNILQRSILLSEICQALRLEYQGQDRLIDGLNLCNRTSSHEHVISYVVNTSYIDVVEKNAAVTTLVVSEQDLPIYEKIIKRRCMAVILADQPEKVFYDIHDYLYYETDFYDKFDFPAKISEDCQIHPSAVIEDGVIIGKQVIVGANSVICKGTVIEDYCSIGCNNTIGGEGFQVLKVDGKNRKIIHCGRVLLRQNVAIGDNNTIAKALFEDCTYLGANTKVDNLVYIAHGVKIGDNVVVTSGCSMAGGAILGDGAWVGINSSVKNRVVVGENATIGMGSVVVKDVPEETLVYGVPARTIK